MPEPVWLRKFKQTWLWDDMRVMDEEINSAKLKVVIGGFYEVLASQILKGEHGDQPAGWDVYPDVILWGKGRREKRKVDLLVEVKGASRKYGFIIDHGQTREYEKLKENEFPFTAPITYYMLFVHNVLGLESMCKTTDDAVNILCTNTIGAILLPMDIIKKWIEWSTMNMYVLGGYGARGRNGSAGHQYFSRMSGPMVERWIHSPDQLTLSMKSLAENQGYEWSMNGWKIKSNFVLSQKIMGKDVSPFLLTKVVGSDWGIKERRENEKERDHG